MIAHRPHARPHRTRAADIHLLGCECPACEPYAPSSPRLRDAAWPTLVALVAGLAAGVPIAALYDRLMPGLQVGLAAVLGS